MNDKMLPSEQHIAVTPGAPPIPKSSGATRWVFIVLGVAAVSGIAYWVQHSTAQQKTAAAAASASAAGRMVPVAAAPVETRDVPIYIEGLGNALPIQQVVVRAQVDGRLDKVFFTEGQQVKQGDVLAQIDPRPFQIQLEQAQAGLARDTATSQNAKLNLDRYAQMQKEGVASQQQVDDQRSLAAQASATLGTDQAQINSARLNLDYARIKSPLDGVTGIRQVDPGNLVHAADVNGVVMVTQLDPMSVIFSLPEDDLPRVQEAMSHGDVEVETFSRDGGTSLGKGKLGLIDNQINQTTATLRLKAIVPNPDKKLWPNQFVKARVLLRTAAAATVIPAIAVQRGPEGTFVYAIAADQTVQPRPVEVLSQQGEMAIITKGVTTGERVVTDGANQLRPGSKVSVKGSGGPKAPKSAPLGEGGPAGSAAPVGSGAPR